MAGRGGGSEEGAGREHLMQMHGRCMADAWQMHGKQLQRVLVEHTHALTHTHAHTHTHTHIYTQLPVNLQFVHFFVYFELVRRYF